MNLGAAPQQRGQWQALKLPLLVCAHMRMHSVSGKAFTSLDLSPSPKQDQQSPPPPPPFSIPLVLAVEGHRLGWIQAPAAQCNFSAASLSSPAQGGQEHT